jgi:pimeloyl-ACP methyl ester carboxylesterase
VPSARRALVVAVTVLAITAPGARAAAAHRSNAKPTVVLEHGAFADASSWDGVIARLSDDGFPVIAPPDPLRGLSSDAAYLSSVLATVKGPVILVAHSYGGAVATNVTPGVADIKALVYVSAFAPDAGESELDLSGKFPGSLLPTSLLVRPFGLPDGTMGSDLYIDPAKFRQVFAQDLPATLAATQRPMTLAAASEKSGPPLWKTVPSWYLVSNQDHAIPPAVQRFMARRAGSRTVSVDSSHASPISHAATVAKLIQVAASATR